MDNKFVVGKWYRNRFSNAIRECLFASEEISVLNGMSAVEADDATWVYPDEYQRI